MTSVAPAAARRRAPQTALGDALRASFARNVRQIRQERGMTQEQLAKAAQINRSFVIRIEKGHFSVTLETVGAIAKALETPPETLIGNGSL